VSKCADRPSVVRLPRSADTERLGGGFARSGGHPVNRVERDALHWRATTRRFLCGLILFLLIPIAKADAPIASSNFAGAENPLYGNGAWVTPINSMAADGVRFRKNNGAFPDRLASHNIAGAYTTAAVPNDHYSEIVVGQLADINQHVGPLVRFQISGPNPDSHYLWWPSPSGGENALYGINGTGTSWTDWLIVPSSPVVDGDRLRLIARGPVIYGIKNGVRDFIYNTGLDPLRFATGTTGMLAYSTSTDTTTATIASWSTGPAPT